MSSFAQYLAGLPDVGLLAETEARIRLWRRAKSDHTRERDMDRCAIECNRRGRNDLWHSAIEASKKPEAI